jgi:N-acetylglucosamine-6-sulfatase
MNQRLFEILESTDGMNMPLYRDKGGVSNLRNPNGPKSAPFPKALEGKP